MNCSPGWESARGQTVAGWWGNPCQPAQHCSFWRRGGGCTASVFFPINSDGLPLPGVIEWQHTVHLLQFSSKTPPQNLLTTDTRILSDMARWRSFGTHSTVVSYLTLVLWHPRWPPESVPNSTEWLMPAKLTRDPRHKPHWEAFIEPKTTSRGWGGATSHPNKNNCSWHKVNKYWIV